MSSVITLVVGWIVRYFIAIKVHSYGHYYELWRTNTESLRIIQHILKAQNFAKLERLRQRLEDDKDDPWGARQRYHDEIRNASHNFMDEIKKSAQCLDEWVDQDFRCKLTNFADEKSHWTEERRASIMAELERRLSQRASFLTYLKHCWPLRRN